MFSDAGCGAAKALDEANKTNEFEITLVSPREGFLLHKIGALRAAIKGPGEWPTRVMVPTTQLFAKRQTGRIVQSTAVSVNEQDKTVQLQSGETLRWDVLIVATGGVSTSPGEPPRNITSQAETAQYFADFAAQAAQSKSVLIVGSGPVGIELAGEIRETCGPQVDIGIVSRSQNILEGPVPVHENGRKSLHALLVTERVTMHLGDELKTLPKFPVGKTWVKTPGGVELLSGKKVECDLVVFATGFTINSGFLPTEWLDKQTGEVAINPETFQLTHRSDVFAFGDVAKTNFTKLGYIAMQDVPVVVGNVLLSLNGQAPTHKISRPQVAGMLVSFGAYQGRGLIFSFYTLGSWLSGLIKTRGMFTSKVWGFAGATLPSFST
ncbi:hypothetical protein BASA81_006732 [Batrachochytrium salamandrivorans]|nr:hypothetical protein BASA81_006732 [Batrachochytrium salamandrivorans]